MYRQSRRELANAGNHYTMVTGPDARDVLDAALRALPRPFARQLRELVGPFDEAFEPCPTRSPTLLVRSGVAGSPTSITAGR